jgi:hypothetical protein
MQARHCALSFVLLFTLAASAFFICYPSWEIEHPTEPALVLSTQRSWIWHPPAHAHMDRPGAMIPVIAIVIVGMVLAVNLRKLEE